MDKLAEKKESGKKESRRKNLLLGVRLKEYIQKIKNSQTRDNESLRTDILLFSLGFLLSRCHLIFGAHPLSLALLCSLPAGIFQTLAGAAVGAISMGLNGIVLAAVCGVAVLIRALLCGGVKKEERVLIFHEGAALRISISVIAGFIYAAYRVLIGGLNTSSMLHGLVMVIITPILTFIFLGLCPDGVDIKGIVRGGKAALLSAEEERENHGIILLQLSTLMLIFFIGLSFSGVVIAGISLTYIFSTVITLLTASRFGALRGMAVGFASSLGASGTLSISFALSGLGAGALIGMGTGYALLTGGAALCAFSAYSMGLTGLLATLPEYLIGTAVTLPILKKWKTDAPRMPETVKKSDSEDMVGTMALSYQNKYSGSIASLEGAIQSLSEVVRDFSSKSGTLTAEDCRSIILGVAECHCVGCPWAKECSGDDLRPPIKAADRMSVSLCAGKSISAKDITQSGGECRMSTVIADSINREMAKARESAYKLQRSDTAAEEYELFSKLLASAGERDRDERSVDESLTPGLTEIMEEAEITDGTVRAFGKRRRHFILAAQDPTGAKITNPNIKKSIEKLTSRKLGEPEYYRRGKMALMECGVRRSYRVEAAFATLPGHKKEVSGDTALTFESSDDYFYSLISDGMGSGRVAKETSEFVIRFMRCALETAAAKEPIWHLLNSAVRARAEECSATVDLFELDLISGEAVFIKSGAAPSFIKRESSIFRIKSHTAPIGLLGSIDSEKIRCEVKEGDYVIMLSDGIADSSEDAPWLLLLLGEEAPKSLKEYANLILSEAIKCRGCEDDMSVMVLKILGTD